MCDIFVTNCSSYPKLLFITFCGKLKNGTYLREIDLIEYFFPLQIGSVIELPLDRKCRKFHIFHLFLKIKNILFLGMSHEANFRANKSNAKQNADNLTVWKQYSECHIVLIGAVLNLIISLTENKVAENGVIVGFSLIEEAIRMIGFTWRLLLLRFDYISLDFTL